MVVDVDRETIGCLKHYWHRLSEPYHCRVTRDAFFEGMVNRYTAEGRHYHTLEHIRSMLDSIEGVRSAVDQYEALAFAAWFHDVIYDTRASDNEERSAQLAARTLRRLQVPSRITDRVIEFILATRGHHPADPSEEMKLFLDIDLSILGAEPEIYRHYCDAIRREYSWLSDDDYRKGRMEVLRHFLNRERIYLSDRYHESLEAQARENLRGELESLAGRIS
jgi:predicted metal-dependent HD superfamily phosphohydrolase